jgi:hypothetical protein
MFLAMTAVQVPYQEFARWLGPPPLERERVETLAEADVADLLLARYRAFVARGLTWQHALLLAVTPDA